MSVQRRLHARWDIVEIADHLDRMDQTLSDRFLDAAERTCAVLEKMPGMGASFPLTNPRLQGLRHHPIRGFPNHLIFYLPTTDYIDVVRVLHGARDLTGILENEP